MGLVSGRLDSGLWDSLESVAWGAIPTTPRESIGADECTRVSGGIGIRQHFGFGHNERLSVGPEIKGVVDACVAIARDHVDEGAGLSMKEFLVLLEKIKRSVERHAAEGTRGYYDFVRKHLP